MNRRELLTKALAVVGASQMDGQVALLEARNPQAIVITLPDTCKPDKEELDRVAEEFNRMYGSQRTIPFIFLPHGAKIEVIDQIA